MNIEDKKLYYRYESLLFSEAKVVVVLNTFNEDKRTPCGVWVTNGITRKLVLDSARKKFAYPTIEEAKVSFIARKRRQILILTNQLERANAALRAMNNGEHSSYMWDNPLEMKE